MTVTVTSTRAIEKRWIAVRRNSKDAFLSRPHRNIGSFSVLLLDYQDPVLKYHIDSLVSEYEQEWLVSAVYLQTNTKVHVEIISYQSRNQLKLFEKCKYSLLTRLENITQLLMSSLFSMSPSQFDQLSLRDHTLSLSICIVNPSDSLSNAYSTFSRLHAFQSSDCQLYIAYANEFRTFQYGHSWSGRSFRLGLWP